MHTPTTPARRTRGGARCSATCSLNGPAPWQPERARRSLRATALSCARGSARRARMRVHVQSRLQRVLALAAACWQHGPRSAQRGDWLHGARQCATCMPACAGWVVSSRLGCAVACMSGHVSACTPCGAAAFLHLTVSWLWRVRACECVRGGARVCQLLATPTQTMRCVQGAGATRNSHEVTALQTCAPSRLRALQHTECHHRCGSQVPQSEGQDRTPTPSHSTLTWHRQHHVRKCWHIKKPGGMQAGST